MTKNFIRKSAKKAETDAAANKSIKGRQPADQKRSGASAGSLFILGKSCSGPALRYNK
jgi:hypothetical protein